jgi:hypothetical protein
MMRGFLAGLAALTMLAASTAPAHAAPRAVVHGGVHGGFHGGGGFRDGGFRDGGFRDGGRFHRDRRDIDVFGLPFVGAPFLDYYDAGAGYTCARWVWVDDLNRYVLRYYRCLPDDGY